MHAKTRVKLQIQFLLKAVMIMGLKLSPSNTSKYITGNLNKGANGGNSVVFLGWNMGKRKEGKGGRKVRGSGKRERREDRGNGMGKGKGRMVMGMVNIDSLI